MPRWVADICKVIYMYINTTGLVLRETIYKDSSKILTVLTASEGKLTVTARGALRKNSRMAAPTQLLAFSEMTLFQSRDRWTLTEAQSIELFSGLRSDIELLSLGSYFAELAEAVTDEDSPNPEILSLCLNALFVAGEEGSNPALVKAAYETRLMALSGFAPAVSHCAACGRDDITAPLLDIIGGTVCCGACSQIPPGRAHRLSAGALHAIRYIIGCDAKKLFAFTVGSDTQKNLSDVAEAYLLAQLDRRFRTLDYLKSIIGLGK